MDIVLCLAPPYGWWCADLCLPTTLSPLFFTSCPCSDDSHFAFFEYTAEEMGALKQVVEADQMDVFNEQKDANIEAFLANEPP
jgi:hypothetical protein